MKVDQYGTATEQNRWQCHWTLNRADGARCDRCQLHGPGKGKNLRRLRCTRHGFATAPNAACDDYAALPSLSPGTQAALAWAIQRRARARAGGHP